MVQFIVLNSSRGGYYGKARVMERVKISGVDQGILVKLCKALNVQVGDLFEYVE
jgi:hypothetical protein